MQGVTAQPEASVPTGCQGSFGRAGSTAVGFAARGRFARCTAAGVAGCARAARRRVVAGEYVFVIASVKAVGR